MNPARVLVTGSRIVTPEQRAYIQTVLDALRHSDFMQFGLRPIVIVQGECPYGGVDAVAKQWTEGTAGATCEGHPAKWEAEGKAAGPIRNAHMVSLGADLCLAFPNAGSRGTWDCLRRAVDAGIPSRLYPLNSITGRVNT